MADHKRLEALTDLIARSGAKLVAVGDGKQLPSIGPGGMFDRLAHQAPTAELADIHRTSDPDERRAWAALRAGEPERAMAHYQARGQLFFTDTRDQAGEAAVKRWAELTETRPTPRCRSDRRRLERRDRPAQRARPAPPRRARRTRRHRGRAARTSTTACTKATSSPSPPSTDHRASPGSRTAHAERSRTSSEHDGLTVTLDGSERAVQPRRRGPRVPAPGLRPARLPPAGRDRRALRRRDRRLADQQGDRLRPGQPRP